MAIVYKHIRKDTNEIFYIGIGNNLRRAYTKKSRNCYWKNIAQNGFMVEIIYENLTWEEACDVEKNLIKLYGRKDLGTGILVNMTDGGDGLSNISDELRNRFKDIAKNRNYSDETKKKMSIIQSRPYNEKYPNSDEVIEIRRKKMVEFNKSYVPSKETNEKISKTLTGRIMSQETKLKMQENALKRWGKDEIKKSVKLYMINNPQATERQVREKFSITRSMFWRLKQTINE
jgi:hypothetical protein